MSPDHILKELAALWVSLAKPGVSLAKPGQSETGAGVLRACSMTFVIVTEECR